MLVLFSSGSRPRYLPDDIFSLPEGAAVQYRYSKKWCSTSVKDKIDNARLVGTDCLLTYIDQTDPGKPIRFVPLRKSVVVAANSYGDFVSLSMNLCKYVEVDNLDTFESELRDKMGGLLPKYEDGKINGKYTIELNGELNSISEIASDDWAAPAITAWQELARKLADHQDFASLDFFYKVLGLYAIGSDAPLLTEREIGEKLAVYRIVAGREYELRLLHYHPSKSSESAMKFEAVKGEIEFLTSSRWVIDSPYDLKRLKFSVNPGNSASSSSISVHRTDKTQEGETWHWEFDILLRVNQPRGKMVVTGLGVGLLLAFPQITSAWMSPSLADMSKSIVSAIALISGLIVGLFATFKIKRSV